MKLLLTGTPVSPSRVTDVYTASGIAPVPAAGCWQPSGEVVPSAGLGRTGPYAAAPTTRGSAGDVSVRGVVAGRPVGMSPRERHQHIDLDPQRPRPCGGCG